MLRTLDTVFCLLQDKPLDQSHRHPSQLMAIHPAMDVTIDGSDRDRQIIEAVRSRSSGPPGNGVTI